MKLSNLNHLKSVCLLHMYQCDTLTLVTGQISMYRCTCMTLCVISQTVIEKMLHAACYPIQVAFILALSCVMLAGVKLSSQLTTHHTPRQNSDLSFISFKSCFVFGQYYNIYYIIVDLKINLSRLTLTHNWYSEPAMEPSQSSEYERFIRTMALWFKKDHVAHPLCLLLV